MNIFVQETYVSVEKIPDTDEAIEQTRNVFIGETDIVESSFDSVGKLFKSYLSTHGRCTGKVYIDKLSGGTDHVGYVFEKLEKYEGSNDKYLKNTWVTLFDKDKQKLKLD